MKFNGKVITVGDMAPEDAPVVVGQPAVQLRLVDGRVVTITGLSRDEAREAAEHFGVNVSLRLSPVRMVRMEASTEELRLTIAHYEEAFRQTITMAENILRAPAEGADVERIREDVQALSNNLQRRMEC